MKPPLRALFVIIFFFFLYHLVRDVMQTFGIHHPVTDVFHWQHQWCSAYCDYVTYPLDLLGVFGSLVVLRRDSLGGLGKAILLSLPLGGLMLALP